MRAFVRLPPEPLGPGFGSVGSLRCCSREHDMPEDYTERRRDLRVEVYLDKLQVAVGVLGFEPTSGVVMNISRGGVKVCLERDVLKPLLGHDCLIRFDSQYRVSEKSKLGKLLRMEAHGECAIEFAESLEVLADP